MIFKKIGVFRVDAAKQELTGRTKQVLIFFESIAHS